MCIYSHKNIGEKGGLTTAKMKQLDPWADGGYMCVNEVTIEEFVMMWKLWCGNYVESQYYNYLGSAANGRRGGLITEDVCEICFAHDDIVSRDEIMKMRGVGGKNPLQICKYCFDSRLKVPTSGGSSNARQKKNQSQAKK